MSDEPVDDDGDRYCDSGLLISVNARRRRLGLTFSRRFWNFLWCRDVRLFPSFRGPVEKPPPEGGKSKIGICCSGGGIRSAAFNLGALQALQSEGVLKKSSYLSAVSGGSYIAAAFSMVAKTNKNSDETRDSDPDLIKELAPFSYDSPEEQYLRNRTTYLAPSAMDMVGVTGRIVFGLLFNLALLGVPIFVLTLLASYGYRESFSGLVECGDECVFHLPQGILFTLLGLLGAVLVLGLIVLAGGLPGSPAGPAPKGRNGELEENVIRSSWREFGSSWWARLIVFTFALVILTVALPWLAYTLNNLTADHEQIGSTEGAGAAGFGAFIALLASIFALLRNLIGSPSKAVDEMGRARKVAANITPKLQRLLAYVGALLVVPLIFLGIMEAALYYGLKHHLGTEVDLGFATWPLGRICLVSLIPVCFFFALTNLNRWSLHSFYKRRLCSAFALRRVKRCEHDPNCGVTEGVAEERPYRDSVRLSEIAMNGEGLPMLIVAAAANVSDYGATPPGRSVTSFTFSPKSIGGPLVGATSTKGFESTLDPPYSKRNRVRDITLPAAVAMSGAAISPAMGKVTAKPLRALLALGNVRLGVWVPNPRWVPVEKERSQLALRPRPHYLLKEMFGMNSVNDKFLYVTDGGHYENLGLVELLRRGCTTIYCFDASGGNGFSDLGDAVALARSELGVEVEIDPEPLRADPATGISRKAVVKGTIAYPRADKDSEKIRGTLYYSRNVMTKRSPWDVHAHQENNPIFPRDSTVDQLYTDQKFESYRVIGEYNARAAIKLSGRTSN